MGNGSFQRHVRCSSEMSKNIFFTTGPHEGADDWKKEEVKLHPALVSDFHAKYK
jgi:hypothetical protein